MVLISFFTTNISFSPRKEKKICDSLFGVAEGPTISWCVTCLGGGKLRTWMQQRKVGAASLIGLQTEPFYGEADFVK